MVQLSCVWYILDLFGHVMLQVVEPFLVSYDI
jgi:hypothetical protein